MALPEKARELPEPLFSFFWSDEPRFVCEDICFMYGVPEESIGEVSWFVAPLLTKEFPPANLPQELRAKLPKLPEGAIFGLAFELNKKILQKFPGQFPEVVPLLSEWERKKTKPALSEQDAHQKTVEVEAWYLDWKKQNEVEMQSEPVEKIAQTVSLPLLDALSKYQRLSEQAVTEDRIVVKGEGQPVRGSIRNWLRHYRDVVGIRKHSAMERGQFLFQGENTKRLSAPDREKLSLLFRSLDENMPISIDVERQEVIFPAFEEKSNTNQAPLEEKATPTLGTSFRPIEKFPASSAPIKKALEWKAEKTAIPPLFGNVPAPPRPEIASSKSVGVSAPVYAIPPIPVSPSADARAEGGKSGGVPAAQEGTPVSSPFSAPGNMSFSSSHVLPHEKAALPAESPQEGISSGERPPSRGPEAISVIKPRGDQFGFRGKSSGDDFDAPRVVNLRG